MNRQAIMVKYDDDSFFRPNRHYCRWASDIFNTGMKPTTDHMQIVFDLMLAGF